MLNYDKFKEILVEQLKDYLPMKYRSLDIEVYKVEKINICMEAICLVDKGKPVSASPVIYIDDLYAHYICYENLADTMKKTAKTVTTAFEHTPDNCNVELSEDNIILVLINYEQNKKLLEKLPHIKYLDLAFVFRWLIAVGNNGIVGGLITKEIADKFGFTSDKLFEIAKVNTRRILPPTVENIVDSINRLCPEENNAETEKFTLPVYLLSNQMAVEGAANIIYTDILEQLRTKLKEDLYIIPSSINELLVAPKSIAKPEEIRAMVKSVNITSVAKDEWLSDNVYVYDGEVKMA